MFYNDISKIDKALQSLVCNDDMTLQNSLDNVISQFPDLYQNLINQTFTYKRVPKEYMMSAILFVISSSTGLTFYIDELGYRNHANCYFAILGSRGDTKSEALKIATHPLKVIDDEGYKNFVEQQDNERTEEIQPKRSQVLLQNATIEAAQQVHYNNPAGIGICMDEIYGLIDKIASSNSRDGIPWRNFFLEGYTNGHLDISRKTTDSFRIEKTCPTLIGGLQYQLLPRLFSNSNLESGFIDRILFTNLITSNNKLVSGSIDKSLLTDYNKAISNILSYKKQSEKKTEAIKQLRVKLTGEASALLFDYTQTLINRKFEAPAIEREYYAKMQISIHKLCLLVYMLRHGSDATFATTLSREDVLLAIDLNEFYFLNFRTIIAKAITQNSTITADDVIRMAQRNNASQKAVAEVTGLHKGTVSKKWSKLATGN